MKNIKSLMMLSIFMTMIGPTYATIPQSILSQQEQLDEARNRMEVRDQNISAPKIKIEDHLGTSDNKTESDVLGGPSFFITHIVLQDLPTELSFLEKLIPANEQKKMSMADINRLVKNLNQKLVDKGYVTTQVRLPEQNIGSGQLVLQIVTGRVGRFVYADGSATIPWQNAFPIREGDILNARRFEQGLEQMKRVASKDVTMQLVPGSTYGETNVVLTIQNTDKPVHGTLGIDNSGLKATGKWNMNAGIIFDNPLKGNDIFSINASGDITGQGEDHMNRQQGFSYSIVNGWDTLSLSHTKYRYHQLVNSVPFSFISSGESKVTRLNWNHVFSRSESEKKSYDITVHKRDSHSFINGTEIPVQAIDTTALEIGVSDRMYIGDSTLYVRLSSKWGVHWFNSPSINLGADGPNTQYNLWNLSIDYRKPIVLGHRPGYYTASFYGQWMKGNNRLYGVEQISMGNRYTVRGFDGEYTLTGESGWYVSQEISSHIQKINSDVYIGLDVGAVYGPSTDILMGRVIAGSVLGLRGQFNSGISYDISIGAPVYKPKGYPTTKGFVACNIYYRF